MLIIRFLYVISASCMPVFAVAKMFRLCSPLLQIYNTAFVALYLLKTPHICAYLAAS